MKASKPVPFILLICLGVGLPLPVFAIPSPDVIVNVFASAGQILGLLSVMFGASFFGTKKKNKYVTHSTGSQARPYILGGLIILLLASLAGNMLQYTSILDNDTRRLYTNLNRKSIEQGQSVGDVSLKTLSFSQQKNHLAGLSTEEFAKLWRFHDFNNEYQFIDVRTPEEYETGSIAGAKNIPQPDIRAKTAEILGTRQSSFLMCESGNRSSELCSELLEQGYQCNFLIGGFQKWIEEQRPALGLSVNVSQRLRDIVDYPNKNILLDTPAVEELVRNEKALFVDVRYPDDYALYNLPDSINIPIRKLSTETGKQELLKLPKQPIIAPCYDKRSCFYAMILGLRLTRLDYDYRGRYTVPNEFVAITDENDFLRNWQTRNERTFFSIIREPIEQFFILIQNYVDGLVIQLFIFVFLLRLAFLPFGVKNDRDQYVMHRGKEELENLRKLAAGHQAREAKLILQWNRQHKINIGINLLGSLLQLFVFLLSFSVVENITSHLDSYAFLWLDAPHHQDPFYILPFMVGALTALLMAIGSKTRDRKAAWIQIASGLLLFAITSQISAALNLYLVFSLSLMCIQTRVVAIILDYLTRQQAKQTNKALLDEPVSPLIRAYKIKSTGNKAARLGLMLDQGLPVPDGFIIAPSAFSTSQEHIKINPENQQEIQKQLDKIAEHPFAVRSSGLNEDGSDKSYAGVFESVLNVQKSGFDEALDFVYQSLKSDRAKAYAGEVEERGCILIQKMVDAEYAGVMFTTHPAESGSCLIEMTEGLGEALVSGSSTGETYRYGRLSGMLLETRDPPMALRPLWQLGRTIEAIFGCPQDIEWAYTEDKFYILQARDITTLSESLNIGDDRKALFERERHRLLSLVGDATPYETVFIQTELSELLPQPTHLSLSFMKKIWDVGGSVDLASQELGIPYSVQNDSDPLFTTIFGKLYINTKEQQRRYQGELKGLDSYRLTRSANDIEDEFREEFVPAFLTQMRTLEGLDCSRYDDPTLFNLLEQWSTHFITETYVQAERINLTAEFYMGMAETQLHKYDLNPAMYLANIPPTEVSKAMSLLPAINKGDQPIKRFTQLYGHRAIHDFELASPRFREDPLLTEQFVKRWTVYSTADQSPPVLPDHRLLKISVERAQRFQALKEDAKHYTLYELALIRELLVEIGRRWGVNDNLFYLEFDEILGHRELALSQSLTQLIAQRKKRAKQFSNIQMPSQITVSQLESIVARNRMTVRAMAQASDELIGTLVAGNKSIEGHARVLTDAADLDEFKINEILVTRFTNPEWTPIFSQAMGVVTEVGGWLSHAAILAREYNLPTVVGVTDATSQIRTGDRIRISLDGHIDII